MNNYNTTIIAMMNKTGLVPLFNHDDAVAAVEIAHAAYRGGARVVEFTNRKQNAIEVFKHLVSNRSQYPEMILGVGTVMDAATTKTFIDLGADFVVSPILQVEMAPVCHENKIPWIPGCATMTEIVTARSHGADVIKIFPGSVLGPGFVSSVLQVVPDLKFMITGGVEPNEQNLASWFNAGSLCVGLGSHLMTKDILHDKAWNKLEANVAEIIATIQKVKSEFTNRSR